MTREEAASCINTIVILKNLCYRVHGLMDVIDAQNCDKIIEMLNSIETCTIKTTDDIISRAGLLKQIGIDAGEGPGYYSDTWKFIDTIKKMPSAQIKLPKYVQEIEAEYEKWKNIPHIKKPLAKALYEVWKKHDKEDAERKTG